MYRDAVRADRFLTIDRWQNEEDWQSFRHGFGAAYESLDAQLEGLAVAERSLFEGSSSRSRRPSHRLRLTQHQVGKERRGHPLVSASLGGPERSDQVVDHLAGDASAPSGRYVAKPEAVARKSLRPRRQTGMRPANCRMDTASRRDPPDSVADAPRRLPAGIGAFAIESGGAVSSLCATRSARRAQACNNSPDGLATAKGLAMTEAIAERVRRYILDGSDEDLRRLLGVAETTREIARSAFRKVGMQEGWHVIDCGCGPVGGLAVMAEMVGPAGRVVGVDFSEAAIQRARSVVAALGLSNVQVFAGDIHELDAAAVGGPFDLAYTRFFLMHQPDPVRTLSRIARLLRPGGWVVAQEGLRSPPPRSHPHLDALGTYWDLVYDLLERAGGVPRHAVDGLAGSARAAGLDVVAVDGSFGIIDPELGFDLHAATLLAARERAVASGIAAGQQIDDLASDLRAAKGDGYEWVTTPFFLDLVLRKPLAA